MSKTLRVLFIEDRQDDTALILHHLRKAGFDIDYERVQTRADMEAAPARGSWDVVLSDFSMPSFNAPAALDVLKNSRMDVPFLIVSGTIGEERAALAMRSGAADYVPKTNLSRLPAAVEREVHEAGVRRDPRRAEAETARLQTELLQSQKMEAVGRLAGGIAHDFNNIVAGILGFTELLTQRGGLPPAQMECVEEIRRAGGRAVSLIKQLLTFSRGRAVRPHVLDLNSELIRMEAFLRQVVGVGVELTIRPEATGRVRIDPGQLEQVIVNLAVNARDAMPDGGRLVIEARDAPASEPSAGGAAPPTPQIAVSVADTGVGIPDHVKPHVFEPFFTTKPEGKGTGLGLATVYGIVHQSGGRIVLDSTVGKGTTFTLLLPRVEPGPAEPAESEPPVN
jgi:signal transduction histidine kinase